MSRGVSLVAAFLGGGVLALGGTAAALQHYLPEGRSLPGTTIEGWVQSHDQTLGQWLDRHRVRVAERPVFLRTPDEIIELTLADVGIELDVAETLAAAQSHRSSGSLPERIQRARRAERGLEHVQPKFTFDEARARRTLERLRPRIDRAPRDARLDRVAHVNVPAVAGRELDVEATLRAIESGDTEENAVFDVQTRPLPARVTASMLEPVDVSKVLSSFDTSFKNKAGRRAINIARAVRYLDGTVIMPGQTLSFNAVVGPRTAERGFVEAPVIVDDETEPGLGGGVCQVATALHAAAVYGLLDVVRRRSHSRPSGYAPLGLDATVIWGEVDLKIRNPYDTPLMVHAFLPSQYVLRVELLGRVSDARVTHDYAVLETQPFVRRVRVKPELPPTEHKRHQKGISGYEVVSTVRAEYPDGRVARRRYESKYWPVPEVFWVGESFDIAQLPPLPDGATGVEVYGPVGADRAETGDHAAGFGEDPDARPTG